LLLDQDDSRSLVRRCPHGYEQALHDNGGKPQGQLVSEQDLGLAGQGAPESEHLLFAAGQQPGLAAKQRLERREEPYGLGRVAVAEPEVLPGRKLAEYRPVISDERHAQLCSAVQAAWRRLAGDGDPPVEGGDGSGDGQQGCCLAGAVRAKERDDLPLVDMDVEVVDDRHVAVTGVQAGGLDQVRHLASLIS
jgi:hypothetical protein